MSLTTTHHRLGKYELMRLSRPTRLLVTEGSLWITLDREPDDLQLEAGSVYDYDGHTPLIASPLGSAATFATTPSEAPQTGWRSWLHPQRRLNRLLNAWA